MRKGLIISLILLLALLSAYAALPRLAEQALITTLQNYGVQVDRFDLQHPGWNRIMIRQLQLQQRTPDYSLQLDIEGIEARFSLLQLFRHTQIEQLTVHQAALDIALHPQPSASGAATLPPAPAALLALLPAAEISIRQLDLTTDTTALSLSGLPSRLKLSGQLSATPAQLDSTLSMVTEHSGQALTLAITADDHNAATVELTLDNSPLLTTRLKLKPEPQQLRIDSHTRLDLAGWREVRHHPLFAPLLAQPYIPEQLPSLQGQLIIEGDTTLTDGPDETALTDAHRYQLQWTMQVSDPAELLPGSPLQADSINLALDATLTGEKHRPFVMTFHQLRTDLLDIRYQDAGVQLSTPRQQLQLSAPVQISIPRDQPDQISVSDISLLLQGDSTAFSVTLPAENTSADTSGSLTYQPVAVHLSQINPQTLSAVISLPAIQLEPQLDNGTLPMIQLSSQLQLQPDTISQRFTLRLQDHRFPDMAVQLSGRSNTDRQTAISSGYWQATPVKLNRIDQLIRGYLPDLPPELIISSGTLQHQGWFDLRRSGLALRLLNRAEGVNLNYDQTRIFDAHWHSETLQRHSGQISDSGELSIGLIDLGLPLQDFQSSYRLHRSATGQQQVTIDSSRVRLLGGEMITLPVSFDPAAPAVDTAVALTHIDLAEVIALEQQQGLSGAGTLNGQMPVRFVDNQLTVSDGQIVSTPAGGWIRFDPPPEFRAMSQANPALSIAFDALENLQYDQLGIELDYLADGTALLKTRLKGNNPDWNNGQPVDLTINIEENLPKLIQALQFTDKLTQTLEKRYR